MLKFSDPVRHHFSRAENLAYAPEVFRNLSARATGNTPTRPEKGMDFLAGRPARRPDAFGRWQTESFAKLSDRGLSKIRKAKQRLVRHFAHLPNGLQVSREQRVLYPRWELDFTDRCCPEAPASVQARSFSLHLQPGLDQARGALDVRSISSR
jgi:hypothetical protein